MDRSDFPVPTSGIMATLLLIASDLDETVRFYTDVLGGTVVFSREGAASVVKLENTWIIINVGGGPTPDKPDVSLEPPTDAASAGAYLNIRVADIATCYAEWTSRGAEFLTEPLDNNGVELRCYMKDPDGRLIEVGQATAGMLNAFGLGTK